MVSRVDSIEELNVTLAGLRQTIAVDWARALFERPQIRQGAVDIELCYQVASASLDEILEGIPSFSDEKCDRVAFAELVRLCKADLGEIVAAFAICRQGVMPYLEGEQAALRAQFEGRLQTAITSAAQAVTAGLKRELDEARRQTALIMDLVRTVGSTLDLSEVLSQAGNTLSAAAGANCCFFYLVNPENELWAYAPEKLPLPAAISLSARRMAKINPDYLAPNDLVWRVIAEKRPFAVFDAQNDPNTSHVEELRLFNFKSFLLVPCLSKGEVVAIAGVSTLEKQKDFSPAEIELAQAVATVVAPAIENARLYQKVEQLAASEERARLAREMHDNLAQSLGAMQMKASLTGELLNLAQIEQARLNVDEMGLIARAAYTDVREAIFHLRSRPPAGLMFLSYLSDYIATYQTCFGTKIELSVIGNPTAGLTDETADQALHIIQEALTNIRKHAGSTLVQIRLELAGEELQVEVEDDGSGFDPGVIDATGEWRHFGLQIMRERAEAIGGRLEIASKPGRGTQVRFFIPVLPVQNPPVEKEAA